jgi:hypothetical protein
MVNLVLGFVLGYACCANKEALKEATRNFIAWVDRTF